MNNSKEIFDQLDSLTEKYLFIRGMCEMVSKDGKYIFKEFDDNAVYDSTGVYDEELLADTFSEESEFEVKCEGYYKFKALLYYSSAQVGNYPPPNVEVPAYYDLLHIEFELDMSKEDYDNYWKDQFYDRFDGISGFFDV